MARGRALGLRREVLITVPVAILLLIVLSVFTLLAFRNALTLLVEERQREAARLARGMAGALSEGGEVSEAALRRLTPPGRMAFVVDEAGTLVAASGPAPPGDLLAALRGQPGDQALGLGPGGELAEVVAGFAPLSGSSGRWVLRVDLPAPILAAQARSLALLTPVVLGVDGALGILLLLFLRHLLAPYESLLARARSVGEGAPEEADEVAFLISTFERAVTALESSKASAGEEDIAVLQRTLASSLESGLLLLDREGRVLSLNPVGSELLEVTLDTPGASLEDLLVPHPRLLELLVQARETQRGFRRRECEIQVASGVRALGLSAHPLRRDDASVRGYLVLFSDLAEVQVLSEQERLAESLSDLGELAAGVAHELRNSLATLKGYLTLIERHPEEGTVGDYLSEIHREADHLQRVLEDFLTFARPGSARIQEVHLGTLAQRAVTDPALGGAPVEILEEGAWGARLRGDPQLLERALRNLLHNAVQASRDNGGERVSVRLRKRADGVVVEVEDDGAGVPEHLRERLFHPFTSGRPGGVGLGLALAHRIAALHGGRLRLEDREGGGTRALLVFPLDAMVTNRIDFTDPDREGRSGSKR